MKMNIVGCRRGKKVINWTYDGTVNSPNNGRFGARPIVRYSGDVLYWGIIVVTTFHVPYSKLLANVGYMGRVNISQRYESTSNLCLVDREFTLL